jgi:cullin 3
LRVCADLIVAQQALCEVPDAEFLDAVRRAWNDHKTSQIMIRDILMYLNSVYVPASNVPNVYDVGLVLFRDTVARSGEIKRRLLDLLLAEVARERNGEVGWVRFTARSHSMLLRPGDRSVRTQVGDDDARRARLRQSRRLREVRTRAVRSCLLCCDAYRAVISRLRTLMRRRHRCVASRCSGWQRRALAATSCTPNDDWCVVY